jgi:FkbM family methyltransferase
VFFQSGSDWITSRIWWDGVGAFEPEVGKVFSAIAVEARCVLDIGAYAGWYSVVAATLNEATRVLTFEANPEIAVVLRQNLKLNHLSNVYLMECAIAAADGEAEFHLGSEGLPPSSSLEVEWRGLHRTITVQTRSIDSVMDSLGQRIVDLVKIDIEGSEGDAITGMRNTIRRCGPVIIVEVLHSHRGRFVDSLNFLTGQGYTFYECTAEALMPLDNSVESLIVAESTNFLAVRNDSRFLSMLDPYIYRE